MTALKFLQAVLITILFRISLVIELMEPMVFSPSHISFDMYKVLLAVCTIKLLDAPFDPPNELFPRLGRPVVLRDSDLQPSLEVFNWVDCVLCPHSLLLHLQENPKQYSHNVQLLNHPEERHVDM